MVGAAVAGLAAVSALIPVLQALGGRHAKDGVQPAHFAVVGEALLWTLEQGRAERWPPEVQAAWAQTYGTVQSVMEPALVGAAEAAAEKEEDKGKEAMLQEGDAAGGEAPAAQQPGAQV
eukprot:552509-Rhodomonas_salina.1